MPRLENWAIVTVPSSPYTPLELLDCVLVGAIYDDDRFDDGYRVHTSAIEGILNGNVMTRSGSLYVLGKVNPDYEAAYPNAKERLLTMEEE